MNHELSIWACFLSLFLGKVVLGILILLVVFNFVLNFPQLGKNM